MGDTGELTGTQKKLLVEMANDGRVILIQRHPRRWMGLRYTVNAFPMRHLQAQMVAKLARLGYIKTTDRGYYVLTTQGMLAASLVQRRKRR